MSHNTARKNKGLPESWEHIARPRELGTLTLGFLDPGGSRVKEFLPLQGNPQETWLLEAWPQAQASALQLASPGPSDYHVHLSVLAGLLVAWPEVGEGMFASRWRYQGYPELSGPVGTRGREDAE